MAFRSQHPIALAAENGKKVDGAFPARGADSPQSRQVAAGVVDPPLRCGHSPWLGFFAPGVLESHGAEPCIVDDPSES